MARACSQPEFVPVVVALPHSASRSTQYVTGLRLAPQSVRLKPLAVAVTFTVKRLALTVTA